jgi:hypothetical protein
MAKPKGYITDNNATTWRDLADQLTSEQVGRFERWEADALNSVATGRNAYASPEDIARCFLVDARREAEQNLTDSTFDAPIPAGASGAEHWEDDGIGRWTRLVHGIQRNVAHLSVGISGEQHPDGTVAWAAYAHADDNRRRSISCANSPPHCSRAPTIWTNSGAEPRSPCVLLTVRPVTTLR